MERLRHWTPDRVWVRVRISVRAVSVGVGRRSSVVRESEFKSEDAGFDPLGSNFSPFESALVQTDLCLTPFLCTPRIDMLRTLHILYSSRTPSCHRPAPQERGGPWSTTCATTHDGLKKPGLGCTSTSRTDPPPRVHLLGQLATMALNLK